MTFNSKLMNFKLSSFTISKNFKVGSFIFLSSTAIIFLMKKLRDFYKPNLMNILEGHGHYYIKDNDTAVRLNTH